VPVLLADVVLHDGGAVAADDAVLVLSGHARLKKKWFHVKAIALRVVF
jgi:hypothetical protein